MPNQALKMKIEKKILVDPKQTVKNENTKKKLVQGKQTVLGMPPEIITYGQTFSVTNNYVYTVSRLHSFYNT